ncbi:MAG TPA: hypothetical protein VD838_13625 [Anaeromyxobacteraceae bacterium]|nr:hypothetical protein [Anaeromyxobacteraceae bacterium]
MPEVVTKHPDVVKDVLQSAGAKCGAGAPQKILTKCPREQFCALPGGEICVYSPKDVEQMTQLSRAELCASRTDASPPAGGLAAAAAPWGLAAVVPAAIVSALVLRRRLRVPPRGT